MTNVYKGKTGLARMANAFGYSVDGLRYAYAGESAFRHETWAASVMLPAAFWVGRGWLEVTLLIASVLLVLIVELLNSAIEATIDRVSFELHELSKRAKDLASAAVLLSCLGCGGFWVAALWHRVVS